MYSFVLVFLQWVTEKRLLMKDFVGIEKCDAQTRSAILNFSFSLSIGDIDQAFKTIRNVKRFVYLVC